MTIKTFQRKETKYVAEPSKLASFLSHTTEFSPDVSFPISHIISVYFDTPEHDVIERSLEKPKYKEKLRGRFYAESPDSCFVELKKKYKGIVYKRRVPLSAELFAVFAAGASMTSLLDDNASWQDRQIAREIDAYRNRLETLRPSFAIAADRRSYTASEGVRATLDAGMWYKVLDVPNSLWKAITDNKAVMELKAAGAYPLWLASRLSEEQIYSKSFSKYGTAYKVECSRLPDPGECPLPDGFAAIAGFASPETTTTETKQDAEEEAHATSR